MTKTTVRDRVVLKIAKTHMGRDTLTPQNWDSADFFETNVWDVKAALEAAYEAGRKESKS